MKLRNKKTGEIKDILDVIHQAYSERNEKLLMNLEKEWEEYEEPKYIWWLDNEGYVNHATGEYDDNFEKNKEIGNYFETKEEAEKAVEKLKALKRLKDKGFRPRMWEWEYIYGDNISGELTIKAHIDDATDSDGKYTKDLDLLFGGEE